MDINAFGHNSFVHTKGLKERIEMTEQKELLKVFDMSEDEQWKWLKDNELISYGLWASTKTANIQIFLADLAFRLSGGKIAGKTPIEYIIDALIAKESK